MSPFKKSEIQLGSGLSGVHGNVSFYFFTLRENVPSVAVGTHVANNLSARRRTESDLISPPSGVEMGGPAGSEVTTPWGLLSRSSAYPRIWHLKSCQI
ncbi:hypothetical protein Ddc_01918 [Ditylenchus destructor]|nr:hypothetical protein Ddc_01918 [Ditylenchus destructor]